ncbi:MAG TPA: hypothetical protein VGD67_09885 [Pseudonocardiaceae bacterium]
MTDADRWWLQGPPPLTEAKLLEQQAEGYLDRAARLRASVEPPTDMTGYVLTLTDSQGNRSVMTAQDSAGEQWRSESYWADGALDATGACWSPGRLPTATMLTNLARMRTIAANGGRDPGG